MLELTTSEELARCHVKQEMLFQRVGLWDSSQTGRIKLHSMEYPIPLKYARSIEARASPLHGIGVFATEAIPAGVLVTHYPAHAFSQRVTRDGEEGQAIMTFGTPSKKFKCRLERLCYSHAYSVDGAQGDRYLLIGDPARHDNPLLLGHMINDGGDDPFAAKLPYETLTGNDGAWLKLSLLQYYVKAVARCNCKFVVNPTADIVSVCSLRQLKPGEELLVSYGPYHWYDRRYDWYDKKECGVMPLSSLTPELLARNPEFAKSLLDLMVQLD